MPPGSGEAFAAKAEFLAARGAGRKGEFDGVFEGGDGEGCAEGCFGDVHGKVEVEVESFAGFFELTSAEEGGEDRP